MKLRFGHLALALLLLSTQFSYAQIDTTRNFEVRFSGIGNTPPIPFIDQSIDHYNKFSNVGISLLRRYKESKYFGKVEIRGRYSNQEMYADQEKFGELLVRNLSIFAGTEKQYQYKHFGVYLGVGMEGGYFNYSGDFTLPEFGTITDLSHVRYSIGPKATATLFTNVTDRLYFFSTFSFSAYYAQAENSQAITEDFEDGGTWNSGMFIDGIGLSYKF